MSEIHLALGVAVIASNTLAAAWGAAAYLRRQPSVVFWYLLRSAQVLVVAQVALGIALLGEGRRPPDELHYLYGIAPLLVTLVSEAMRVGAAPRELEGVDDVEALDRREQARIARAVVIREMGIMTVGAILIVTLSLRAAATSGRLF